jgi:LacI family transcriptional regulator
MITIKDIARRAGVSYATVSRALNNHPEINIETRKKIARIAAEIGYQPNAIARGLVKKETNTIGLLIPDITNPFYPEVARGIEDAANETGYTIFLCNTNWKQEREENYLNVLHQKQVDGIIIAPASEKPEHLQRVVGPWAKKMVFISRVNFGNVTSVLIDNVRGGRMAVEYLIGKGLSAGPPILPPTRNAFMVIRKLWKPPGLRRVRLISSVAILSEKVDIKPLKGYCN